MESPARFLAKSSFANALHGRRGWSFFAIWALIRFGVSAGEPAGLSAASALVTRLRTRKVHSGGPYHIDDLHTICRYGINLDL